MSTRLNNNNKNKNTTPPPSPITTTTMTTTAITRRPASVSPELLLSALHNKHVNPNVCQSCSTVPIRGSLQPDGLTFYHRQRTRDYRRGNAPEVSVETFLDVPTAQLIQHVWCTLRWPVWQDQEEFCSLPLSLQTLWHTLSTGINFGKQTNKQGNKETHKETQHA